MVIPEVSTKERVMELIKKKEQMERSINDLGHVLSANNNVGMNEPLIDEFGFPRNDIDVYQVRQARNQINCLQNDLKCLMKEIEQGLIQTHAEARVDHMASTKMANMEIDPATSSSSSSLSTSSNVMNNENSETINQNPFLTVTFVNSSSPADACGLRADDEIIEFGSINIINFKELKQISELVLHRKNEPILLKIKRNGNIFDLTLVPKDWSGRGLLGCNIVIINIANN